MENRNVEPGTIIKKVELKLKFRDDFVPPKNEDFVYNYLGSVEKDPEACDLCPFYVWLDDYGYGECTLCNAVAEGDDENTCPLRKFFDEKKETK